ncbi:MAG TPA: hypothetical protein VGX71_13700 [Pseudaminobacter sp.]|nr:hypothetical protein [Pseudaminobacter sp.]
MMQADIERAARKTRAKFNRVGRKALGRCVFAERGRHNKGAYSNHLQRLREIELIITSRYGKTVPETDDADAFIRAAAFSINARCRITGDDFDKALDGWCSRWAPWALPKAGTILRPIMVDLYNRVHDMTADDVARLLCVKLVERVNLGLKTIGAFDVTRAERKRFAKGRKRDADRLRQAENRKAAGRQSRESYLGQSLSTLKPWEAEGISRPTWYRRKRETGLSLVEEYTTGDTLVSKPSTPPEGRKETSPLGSAMALLVQASKGASSLQSHFPGAANANADAEPLDVERPLIRLGVANA